VTTPDGPDPCDTDVLARLDRLEELSRQRTAELQQIAAQLPAVVGRRAMIRTLVGDALVNGNKREALRRVKLKLARIHLGLRDEARHGFKQLASRAR
jgi:hypothetical protein